MQKPKNLKALLVDMDGTIANSMPLLYKAYAAFMDSFNLPNTKEEFSELVGPSLNTIISLLQKKHHLPHEQKALRKIYLKKLELLYAEPIPLFPNSRECLNFARKHLQCILVTSATSNLARAFLQGQKLENAFDHLVTGDLVDKGKPDPDLYLLGLKKAHAKPSEAIAIEDSTAGVKSAQGAKIPTFWIFGDTQNPLNNPESSVMTVNNWDEILALLRSWYE